MTYNQGLQMNLRKASARWSRGRPVARPSQCLKIFGILFGVCLCTYVIVHSRLRSMRVIPKSFIRGNIINEPTCRLPVLPVDNPDIMAHIKFVPPIKCTDKSHEEDWVQANGSWAEVTSKAMEQHEKIQCEFADIKRDGDFQTVESAAVTGLKYEFKDSDFVHVKCKGGGKSWSSYLAAPRSNVVLPENAVKSGQPMNVLIWGHDSLSRNMFIRKLPQSYQYLMEELKGIILSGYNIVGDGTPQALIPILTSKTELELPDTRKRKGALAQHVDVYPFVWKEYKDKGYLTGYMEDSPDIGTFTYRLKGFEAPPTDYYMRPFFLAAQKSYNKYMKYCVGSIPRHQIMMNYVKDIMEQNPKVPKFLFSFHSELSHSSMNMIQGADEDLKAFLRDLKSSGALNNTLLIVMSDHGSRFSNVRQTETGKQEERMPMFMFVFPLWFRHAYPKAYKNFQRNSHILSTPFDIHATLKDFLHISDLKDDYFSSPNSKQDRSQSLFRPISPDRTCKDASIEPHWCACLQWQMLNTTRPAVQRAAQEFVDYVNHYVQNQTSLCSTLKLNRILGAANLAPGQELLRFKQSADLDGFQPDFSDKMMLKKSTIQLKVETLPGGALFEVSLTHDLVNNKFLVDLDAVSRINKYGSQANCIESTLEHLRKYCYCDESHKY